MTKLYATCRLDGRIELHEQHPGNGYFALAVGEPKELREVIDATAKGWRVPGVQDGAEARQNLEAIAVFIRDVSLLDVPGVRALGV
ncbi:hypothetical protein D3C76_654880 [compost metagenome]